jgi:ParB family chromosome partitioning protein
MTEIITVALNKLDADPNNVRKTYSAEGIAALAANIRADDYRLLQNLVVRKGDKKGRYFVVAGGRRFAALKLLAEAGEIAKDYPVECKEREGEIATEISLAENIMREEMHPLDQYEAFDVLAKQGKDITDIAARFGTAETVVRKRLALARVSPVLLQQFRDEDMSFAQLSAFTVSDDHERQVTVWNSLPSWNRDPHSIRRALTEAMVPATDKRVQFIGGLAAYEEAGGSVKRDLFDDRNAGYAMDGALVEKLAAEKLEAVTATVRAEGWKWVECSATAPAGFHSMKRHYPETAPLSEEDQAALDAAQSEYDALAALIESGMANDEAEAKLADVEKRIDALDTRTEAYSSEALAQGGAFVFLDYYGRLSIERGFVKPEDADESTNRVEDGENLPSASGVAKPSVPTMSHSAALIEDLTAHKTAALRIELANNPDVALVAVVHAMLLHVAYPYNSEQSALQLSLTHERLEPSMKDAESCKGLSAFNDLAENYGHHLPGDPADLFDWLMEQPQDMVLSLLAFGAAHSVNAVEKKFTERKRVEQANQLGRALKVNMPDWFETTGDSYFKHVNRTTIELALAEAGSEAELSVRAAAKKSEAVMISDRLVAGSGWLPVPVRIAPAVAEQEVEAESIAQDA